MIEIVIISLMVWVHKLHLSLLLIILLALAIVFVYDWCVEELKEESLIQEEEEE